MRSRQRTSPAQRRDDAAADVRRSSAATESTATEAALREQRRARRRQRRGGAPSPRTVRRARSSPLVRRIAKEHNVDISSLHGSGIAGRVTKHDILDYLGPAAGRRRRRASRRTCPAFKPGERVEIAPMSVMRKKIAEHMVLSRRTSAHVHSVFEVNFSRVAQIREQKKAEYERQGAKLTYLSFILKAVVECADARSRSSTRRSTATTSSTTRTSTSGIAVALDWGLIVPVVKNADEKNLLGLSRAIADLADARPGQAAEAGRSAGRDVHDHEPRRLRRAVRHADHQPAAGGDPRRRRDREAGRGRRRCDRDPADGVPHARLRPPADRRRGRRRVHVAHQGHPGELRSERRSEEHDMRELRVHRLGRVAYARRRCDCSARWSRTDAPTAFPTRCCCCSIRTC